jgi:hypothetical protein
MRLMRLLLAFRGRGEIDVEPPVLHFGRIDRNLILLISRLPLTGSMVKLPVVPGTDDIVAVECAFTQRATDMVADS